MKPASNWAAAPQIHVAGVLLVFMVLAIGIWLPSGFVPLSSPGIGEMFEAYHGALNIERFGWVWGGLQDMATNPDPVAHPVLYIHHPNVGLYISYILRRIGIVEIETQNALSLLATLCGLIAAYVFARRASGSSAVAVLLLALLAFDLNFIADWAFNIHRAFSYLAFFGVFIAVARIVDAGPRHVSGVVVAIAACLLMLGGDYMFYFFTLFVLLGFCLTQHWPWRCRMTWVVILLAIYGLGFVLRQLQVMVGIGVDVWLYDFLYQVLNRLGVEAWTHGAESEAAREFYRTQAVLNPGFSVVPTFIERGYQFTVYAGEAFLRNLVGVELPHKRLSLTAGLLFLAGTAFMVVIVHVDRLRAFVKHLSLGFLALLLSAMLANAAFLLSGSLALTVGIFGIAALGLCAWLQSWHLEIANPAVLRPLALWAGLFLVACIAMILVFPTYFANWYRTFLLGPACTTLWSVMLLAPLMARAGQHHMRPIVLGAAVKIVSLAVALSMQPNIAHDHAAALRALRGIPTASNFTPASVASYTQAFSGFLTPSGAERLLATGEVRPEDYFMMFERDRENPLYRHPRYFVYLKHVDIFAGDWSFIERLELKPVSEGASYTIYAVPSTGGAAGGGERK